MLVKISPEALEVANTYLVTGSLQETATQLGVPQDQVAQLIATREAKAYIDQVYLDQGYRNRSRLAGLLDRIIESKLEEAEETGIYSDKDLVDIIKLVHQMRQDEIKTQVPQAPRNQTNVQINEGGGNYQDLIKKLLECPND